MGRLARNRSEPHRGIGEKLIPLVGIAAATGSHNVLPGVGAASTPWMHVVDALSPTPAVLAAMPISREDASAAQGGAPTERHSNVIPQLDDAWDFDHEVLGPQLTIRGVHQVGLAAQHQHAGATLRHDAQWLVSRVEYEGRCHGARP